MGAGFLAQRFLFTDNTFRHVILGKVPEEGNVQATLIGMAALLFLVWHCNSVIMTRMQAVGYANRTSYLKAAGDLVRRTPLRQIFLCGSYAQTNALYFTLGATAFSF